VAVLGVDNDQLVCELTCPPLSSVDQAARRVGFEAAAVLDRLMRCRGAAGGPPGPARTAVVVPPVGVVTRASTDTLATEDAVVVAMLQALREQPFRKPAAAAVAARAGISRLALEQRFQAAVGRSVHGEFVRQRVQRLRGLIVDSELPLKAVAARAGFPSPQYMTTFLRRHTGITPARLRAAGRHTNSDRRH